MVGIPDKQDLYEIFNKIMDDFKFYERAGRVMDREKFMPELNYRMSALQSRQLFMIIERLDKLLESRND